MLASCLLLHALLSVCAQSSETDQLVTPPDGLWTDAWTLEYVLAENPSEVFGNGAVNIGIADGYCKRYGETVYTGNVYMQGLCPQLPDAWVKAVIDGEIKEYETMPGSLEVYCHLRVSLPQYLGCSEETGDLYLTAFDGETGDALNEVELEYRPFYNTINNLSAPLCISTSPTEDACVQEYTYLSLQLNIPLIQSKPEGTQYTYNRTGGVVNEVRCEPEDPDNPYMLNYTGQTGTVNIVFAADNKVYIQQPVSEETIYSGWVEGTLSNDGTTITVPTGQYIDYTRSFNMAVQFWVCTYDESQNSFFPDTSIKEVTFTIEGENICLNGTSETRGLGYVNRVFGLEWTSRNGEWLQTCDYESVYTPFEETPLEAPEGLQTETYHMTTCYFISEWSPLDSEVEIGFLGDEVWLKGICQYLPDAWIKGQRNGESLVFHPEQYLGSADGIPIYFKDVAVIDDNTVVRDMELTYQGNDTYTTTDYIFLVTEKGTLNYLNYYMGATVSKHEEEPMEVPQGLTAGSYVFSYETVVDDSGNLVASQHAVIVGYDGEDVYIRGLWEGLPYAWVKGRITNDNLLAISLPQYLGIYNDEYMGSYPIYLTAFNPTNGELQPELTFNYKRYGANENIVRFDNPSHPISIGICKTGYLGLQDFYGGVIANGNPTGIISMHHSQSIMHNEVFDLQGRALGNGNWLLENGHCKKGVHIVHKADGTVCKVLVK